MIENELQKYYLVTLYPNTESEAFNFVDENFLEVKLQQNENASLKNHEYEVELNFTLDGLLGFSSELIRQAIDAKHTDKNQTVLPQAGEPYFYRGVHLTDNSPDLVPLINENLELSVAVQQEQIRRQKKVPFILAMTDPCATLFQIEKYKRYNESELKNKNEDQIEGRYFFNLFTNRNEIALYEGSSNNAGQVKIKNLNTLQIYDKETIPVIYLNLNSNGMLQLGEELIRIALNIQIQLAQQVIPFQEYACDAYNLGLYLAPDSAYLRIKIHPFNKIKVDFLLKKRNKIYWPKNFQLNIIKKIFKNQLLIQTMHSKKESLILAMGGHLEENKKVTSQDDTLSIKMKSWLIPYTYPEEAIQKIIRLKNENFMFYLNDNEYSPVNLFCDWRIKGKATGRILGVTEITEPNHHGTIILQTGYCNKNKIAIEVYNHETKEYTTKIIV